MQILLLNGDLSLKTYCFVYLYFYYTIYLVNLAHLPGLFIKSFGNLLLNRSNNQFILCLTFLN